MSTFTRGGTWRIVTDLAGAPTHEQGGIDVIVNGEGVFVGDVIAEDGVVVPGGPGDPPTTADSLRLYNNALQLANFYSSKGGYTTTARPTLFAGTEDWGEDAKQIAANNLNHYRMMWQWINKGDMRDFHSHQAKYPNLTKEQYVARLAQLINTSKSAPAGQGYYSDVVDPLIDIFAPQALMDYRIAPQHYSDAEASSVHAMIVDPSGATGTYTYDPIAVKPWNLLTPDERAVRIAKYGYPPGAKPAPATAKPTAQVASTPRKRSATPPPVPNPPVELADIPQQTATPQPPATLDRGPTDFQMPVEPHFSLPEGIPVYGPARSLIGVYTSDKRFVPDTGNQARRTPVNQQDTDLLNDPDKLKAYLQSKGVNYTPGKAQDGVVIPGDPATAAAIQAQTQGITDLSKYGEQNLTPPVKVAYTTTPATTGDISNYYRTSQPAEVKKQMQKKPDIGISGLPALTQLLVTLTGNRENFQKGADLYNQFVNYAIARKNNPMTPEEKEFRNRVANAVAYGYPTSGSEVGQTADQVKKGFDAYADPDNNLYMAVASPERVAMRHEFIKQYLGINDKPNYLTKAQYTPSTASNNKAQYFDYSDEAKQSILDDIKSSGVKFDDLIKSMQEAPSGKAKNTYIVGAGESPSSQYPLSLIAQGQLGHFTMSNGSDEKGPYLSYYDKWDLNPDLLERYAPGVDLNKYNYPFEIYGRIYKKDLQQ